MSGIAPEAGSENKRAVAAYMAAFEKGDRPGVLACLTEDVVWELPGAFRLEGKEAFAKEIRNDAFQGDPEITVARLTEDGGVVIAEGRVRTQKKTGEWLRLAYCDVFEMRGGKIAKLTSYLMEVKA